MSRCWIILSVLMLCLVSGTAHAESRVAVRPFFGPHADDVRKEILAILSQHRELTLVNSGEVEQSAKRMRVDANSPEGRVVLAGRLGVAAWVEAIVQRQGRELRVTVLVYDGRNHQRIARTVLTRRTPNELTNGIRRSFWRESRDALLSAEAPPRADGDQAVAAATPVEETTESEAPEAPPAQESPKAIAPAEPSVPAESPASSSMALGKKQTFSSARWNVSPAGASVPEEDLPDALLASFSLGTLSRALKYQDPQTLSLGNYTLAVAPQATLDVQYYPGAHVTAGWPSYIGLDVKAQLALVAASETKDGQKYSTSADSYAVGARVRIPFDQSEATLVAGYGIRRFQFADSKKNPSPTPDVDYRYLRLGAGGDFAVGEKLSVGSSAAFLWVVGGGEIASADWFPRTTGNGFEAAVFGSYGLTASLDLVANLSIEHFFFSFNPESGDPKVAGGATDDFVTGSLGIRLRL